MQLRTFFEATIQTLMQILLKISHKCIASILRCLKICSNYSTHLIVSYGSDNHSIAYLHRPSKNNRCNICVCTSMYLQVRIFVMTFLSPYWSAKLKNDIYSHIRWHYSASKNALRMEKKVSLRSITEKCINTEVVCRVCFILVGW